MNKLYVLVGVPGSGKSTWVKNQDWTKECAYVSTDEYVESYAKHVGKTYSEVFDLVMKDAVASMVESVIMAKSMKQDVIWDQTSTSIATRAKKIRMLPEYYKIAVVFKTPPTSELMSRLASRPGKNVPWEVVSDMAQKLEIEPPSTEEGFDEIWYN